MIEGRQVQAASASGRTAKGKKRGKAVAAAVAADRLDALREMARHYGNAERLAREANADNLFYPAKNGISAELRLAFLERRPAELAVDRMRAVQDSLARASSERPDFWSVVGQIELRVLVAVAAQQLAGESAALIAEFTDLKARVPGANDVGLGALRSAASRSSRTSGSPALPSSALRVRCSTRWPQWPPRRGSGPNGPGPSLLERGERSGEGAVL